MPIVRKSSQGSGLQRRGRIRLGIQVPDKDGIPRPRRTDYFVLKDAPIIAGAYGPEPTMLHCALAGRTVTECLRAFYERYSQGGAMLCQGTGECLHWHFSRRAKSRVVVDGRVTVAYTEEDGQTYRPGDAVPCGGPDLMMYDRCKDCRLETVLSFFVLDPADPMRFVGNDWAFYDISTGSGQAHDHITDTLILMEKAANAAGRGLFGIRFTLELAPAKASVTNDKGERIRVSRPILRLTPAEEWTEFVSSYLLRSAEGNLLPEPGDVPMLPEYAEPTGISDMPPALVEIAQRLRDTVDDPPPTLDHAQHIIEEIAGALDWNAVVWRSKDVAGLAATDPIEWPGFYPHLIEGVIAVLRGD